MKSGTDAKQDISVANNNISTNIVCIQFPQNNLSRNP